MEPLFCNQCGHQNPADSSFCSACGAPLHVRPDQTLTLQRVDPLQESPGTDDDLVVPVGEILVEGARQGLARFASPLVAGPPQVVTSALEGSAEALGGCELVLRGITATAWDAAS